MEAALGEWAGERDVKGAGILSAGVKAMAGVTAGAEEERGYQVLEKFWQQMEWQPPELCRLRTQEGVERLPVLEPAVEVKRPPQPAVEVKRPQAVEEVDCLLVEGKGFEGEVDWLLVEGQGSEEEVSY